MTKKTKAQVRAEEVRKRMLAEQRSKPSTRSGAFMNDPFKTELASFELQEK